MTLLNSAKKLFSWINGTVNLRKEVDNANSKITHLEDRIRKLELDNASNTAALNIISSAAKISFPSQNVKKRKSK